MPPIKQLTAKQITSQVLSNTYTENHTQQQRRTDNNA